MLSGGINYSFSDDLRLQLHASHLNSDFHTFGTTSATSTFQRIQDGESTELTLMADGDLIDLPAGSAKFSLGGGFFDQEFLVPSTIRNGVVSTDPVIDLEREYTFAFGEAFLPIVSEEQNVPGIRRLELSAAARFTEYDEFGSDTSPRVGILWSPISGVNVRGTYAQSFRAPSLSVLGTRGAATIFNLSGVGLPDPFSADGSTNAVFVQGVGGRSLTPETAESYTIGLDFKPGFIEGLNLSITYYNIEYKDRVASADPTGGFTALFDPATFSEIFVNNPSVADFEEILTNYAEIVDVFGFFAGDLSDIDFLVQNVGVIVDARIDNLSKSNTDGIDFLANYSHDVGWADVSYGLRMTYTLNSTQNTTDTSPDIELLDTLGNPTSIKLNGSIGFARDDLSAQLNVNFVDSYDDVFQSPTEQVDSWTTIDLNLRYDFQSRDSLLDNVVASLTINNMLNEDPPRVSASTVSGPEGFGLNAPIGYDPVNANPTGRFITVGLTKTF